jgi:fibronectin-binding autotransporter adhesin
MRKSNSLKRSNGRLVERMAFAAAASSTVLATRVANAASIDTWVGSSGSTDWATTGNWTDSSGGNSVSAGDSLVFTSANNSTSPTLTDTLTGTSFNIAGITFNSGALAYTMTGNAFALTGNITNNSTSLETINNAISTSAVESIITTSGGGNITLGGNISGASGGLTIAGPDTVTLSGVDGYGGATTVNGGTLTVSGSLSSSSSIVLGGGTFNYAPTSTGNTQTMNGLTLNSGGSAISGNAMNALSLQGITRNAGGTVVFTLPSGTQSATNGVTTSAGNSNNILGPWAIVSSGGTAGNNSPSGYTYATVSGVNIIPYIGAIAATTTTSISAGTLAASGNNYDYNQNTTASFGNYRILNTIRYTGTGLTLNATNASPAVDTLTMNGLLNAGTGSFTILNTNGTSGATPRVNVIIGANNGNELVLSAETAPIEIDTIIQDGSVAGSVTVSGANTVTLAGTNTFSGGLTLNTGTLNINNATALGAGTGAFTINGGTINNTTGSAITESNNNAQAWNGNFTFTGSSGLNLGTGAVTLGVSPQVTVSGSILTVGGVIGGSGLGLTKAGGGTLLLSGANSYSGINNLNGGVLQISASNNLGNAASTNTIGFNGGTLESLSGTYDLGSTRAITLNGAGTIQSDSGTLTVSGAITNGSNLLTVTGAGNTTISGAIGSGSGGITKTGTGALTLSASNSFTGATAFGANNSGTIVLANPSAIAAGSSPFNFSTFTGNSLDIATNGGDTAFANDSTTGFSATIVSDRATSGAGINHALGGATYGGGSVTISAGSLVSSGTASISLASLTLSSANTNPALASVTFTPTGATISIGPVTTSNSEPKSLILDGTSAGNAITGAIAQGTSAALTITKSNASTWTLSGAASYSGGTNISGGTLRINGTNSGAGAVTVSSSATLGGSGTIGSIGTTNGTITISGTITAGSDGATSGKLTSLSTAGVTLDGGSGYTWKVNNGTGTAGMTSGWDEIATQGVTFASLGSSSEFTVYVTGTPTNLQSGTKDYIIATAPSFSLASSNSGNGTIPVNTILVGSGASSTYSSEFALDTTGFFASASPAVGSSSSFQLEVVSDATSGDDLDVVYTAYSATPEPGTAMLLLTGGVAPILMRRRRRRQHVSR